MESGIKEVLDAIDDLRFEIEEIKAELNEIKLMVQDVIDKLGED